MAEINFYHLEREPFDVVLVRILSRLVREGERTSVHISSDATLQALSQRLWVFEDVAFLAHGTGGDDATIQPIWLTTGTVAANGAGFRFYAEGCWPDEFSGVVKAGVLFDGNDNDAVVAARIRWKQYKAEGYALRYWKQSAGGQWQDQATSA